jgi:CRP-like cAMP-binding protein
MNQYTNLLETLPQHVATRLAANASSRRIRAGEVAAPLGLPLVALVVRGWFRLSRFDEQGGQYFVLLRRPGRFIGLESAVGANVWPSEVVALGPGELLTWPAEEFTVLARSDASLALGAARALVELAEEEAAARHLTRTTGLGPRIAQLLLLYAAETGEPTPQGFRVVLPFNQQDLAEILEVRRETISTKTCQLEHAGVIERSGRSDRRANRRRPGTPGRGER